jgi:hypothetical protein
LQDLEQSFLEVCSLKTYSAVDMCVHERLEVKKESSCLNGSVGACFDRYSVFWDLCVFYEQVSQIEETRQDKQKIGE